jgi:hypothetical protein
MTYARRKRLVLWGVEMSRKYPNSKTIDGKRYELIGIYSTRKLANETAKNHVDIGFGTIKEIEYVPGWKAYNVWGTYTARVKKTINKMRKSIVRV